MLKDVKKFWNDRPCNIRHSEKEIGTKEYFSEVSDKKFKAEPHILPFMEVSKWQGKTVLDAGCGIGSMSREFVRYGANVTAVDISEESVALTVKMAGVFGITDSLSAHTANLETIADDNPDFKDSFDLVWSFGVVHHTPNPERAIEQLYRVCKPGGTIKLMLYSLVSWKALNAIHEEARDRPARSEGSWNMKDLRETIRINAEAQVGCPVAYVYSFDDVKKLLEPRGFKIIQLEKDHIFTWDVEEYKKGNWVKSKEWEGVSDEDISTYSKELGWHTLITAIKSESGVKR
jgi:SAM-dependent methyltransferase